MLFEQYPKVSLLNGVTPIEHLHNLSKQLATNIYIKRDDNTGFALGGNKARKLEYLIADALEQGADTIVTCGGVQSNHARQTAAAAAKFGLNCHLILEDVAGTPVQDYHHSGNVLLNKLFGAAVHKSTSDNLAQDMEKLALELKQQGAKPYIVPMGGSSVVGSLGYLNCGLEIAKQLADMAVDIDIIVHATGSAGTQAGLLTGLAMANVNIPILGVCVSRSGEQQQNLVWQLCQQIQQLVQLPKALEIDCVRANGRYFGAGYGQMNEATKDVMLRVAQTEAILLDPVYTGKAMLGLIDLIEQGELRGKNCLFIHTGGAPGIFGYASEF